MSKKKNNFKLKIRAKAQSERQIKASKLINSAVMEYFNKNGVIDPTLDRCPLSITKVTISSDLRVANCFFLPFNTAYNTDYIMAALERSKFVIRDYVTRKINLKYSPELRFYHDHFLTSIEKGGYIVEPI